MSPIIDFSRVIAFQWDEGNASKSKERHGVSQSDAEQIFVGEPILIARDLQHSQSEQRYNALGRTVNGRLLHVTFTLRNNGAVIRVISARDMSRRERNRYAQET